MPGVGAVQADRDTSEAGFRDAASQQAGNEGAVGGQCHLQPARLAVGRQVEHIPAQERFTAGQHQNGGSDFGDPVNQPEAFRQRQLLGRDRVLRDGATMRASQVAALRDLPIDKTRARIRWGC
jgi:hypothetical protein